MNIEQETGEMIERVGELTTKVEDLRTRAEESAGEVKANLSLAIRHLEDAQNRIERAWCRMGLTPRGNAEGEPPFGTYARRECQRHD